MKKAVIWAIDFATMQSALANLGVTINPDADKTEGALGIGCSPSIEIGTGIIRTVALSDEPNNNQIEFVRGLAPNLFVDWVEGETEQVEIDGVVTERALSWPSYSVTGKDGTTTLYAGVIQ